MHLVHDYPLFLLVSVLLDIFHAEHY
jgi:hypothetical protein